MGCGISALCQRSSARTDKDVSTDVTDTQAVLPFSDPAKRADEDIQMIETLSSDLHLVPDDDPRTPAQDDFAIGAASSGQVL